MASPNGAAKASALPLLKELPGVADVVWATVARLANAPAQTSVLLTAVENCAGTTVLASATAMGLAQHQRATVCLLETNLRRPAVAGYLGLESTGLSDVLDGRAELEDCLQEPSDCPGLFVLPAGTPRAPVSGEFTTDRMSSIVDRLKQRCDYLVLDAAPLLDHIETRLLLRHTDAVLLVLRAKTTRRIEAERAHDILIESGTPLLGSIFNDYRTEGVFSRTGRPSRWLESPERAERLYASVVRLTLRGETARVRIDDSAPERPELAAASNGGQLAAASNGGPLAANGSPELELPALTEEGSDAAHRRQIDILERRIAKLNQLLAQTEADLLRTSRMNNVDPGIPSVYRNVQGLLSEDEAHAFKRSLMQQIFQANLELKLAMGQQH